MIDQRNSTLNGSNESSSSHLGPILNDGFRGWLISRCMYLCDCSLHDAEDIVQEVYLNLVRTKRFDPSKSKITTYAMWWLRGMIARRNNRITSKAAKALTVNSEVISDAADMRLEPVGQRIEKSEQSLLKKEAYYHICYVSRKNLEPLQHDAIFDHGVNGKTFQEIGKRHGVSKQSAWWQYKFGVDWLVQNAFSTPVEMELKELAIA